MNDCLTIRIVQLEINDFLNPRESAKKLVEIINSFSKVSGYKINAHKSSAFLYTSKTSQQQELEREIPFRITLDNIKYLEVYLPRQVQELYEHNYKTLTSQIKNAHG